MRSFPWAPVVFTTATTGQRTQQILSAAAKVGEEHNRRVSTGTLNQVIKDAIAWKNPPSRNGRIGRIYYVTQAVRNAFAGARAALPAGSLPSSARLPRSALSVQPHERAYFSSIRAAGRAPADVCLFRERPEAVSGHVRAFPALLRAPLSLLRPRFHSLVESLAAVPDFRRAEPDSLLCRNACAGNSFLRYTRYLERAIRENIGLKGTPIKLLFRGKAILGVKAQAGTNEGPAKRAS